MKPIFASMLVLVTLSLTPAMATQAKKGALDKEPDLFASVTPDRLLGGMSRREWLTLWPVPGRDYWAAWDCKGRSCDNPKRVHIRANAKLIPRTDADPKPIDDGAGQPKE